MKLFDHLFKKSTLDKIKKNFHFLTTDFGFELMIAKKADNLRAENYLVYRNELSEIQIEICADEQWFHSEIRRIINGIPAAYYDRANCLSFEDLAMLEFGDNYNHLDYFAGGHNGLNMVIANTVKLFKRNQKLLASNFWIDASEINQLRRNRIEKNIGTDQRLTSPLAIL